MYIKSPLLFPPHNVTILCNVVFIVKGEVGFEVTITIGILVNRLLTAKAMLLKAYNSLILSGDIKL